MTAQTDPFGPATRAEALRRLDSFQPHMGTRYAHGRNFDHGPGQHSAVSGLSPYLRRRLVTEPEVIAAGLAAHGIENAEKFLQEVLWRGYFKGWLERRPQVWDAYVTGRNADLAALQDDAALGTRIATAEAGETGLACFDAWARELVQTGYLHNHARMWFASIWIFTFRLPWRLGADFFYRHLLDGDPASNTCSWRWVAGLHTRGKPYEARAWNITKFTNHRFTPLEADLASDITGLEAEEPDDLPDVRPLRDVTAPDPALPTALLLTEEDCTLDQHPLTRLNITTTARLLGSALRSPRPVAEAVKAFEADALHDTARRIGRDASLITMDGPTALADWAESAGARQIATGYIPTGPLADWIAQAQPHLQERGITLAEWRRDWDTLIWPHATAGYFKVKKKMPVILQDAGLI